MPSRAPGRSGGPGVVFLGGGQERERPQLVCGDHLRDQRSWAEGDPARASASRHNPALAPTSSSASGWGSAGNAESRVAHRAGSLVWGVADRGQ